MGRPSRHGKTTETVMVKTEEVIFKRIHALQGTARDEISSLPDQLKNGSVRVRLAAVICLYHKFDPRKTKWIFLEIWANEPDSNVAMMLVSA
jgi:hypothetical protein